MRGVTKGSLQSRANVKVIRMESNCGLGVDHFENTIIVEIFNV
jgi:hypothetical protein